jgi:hypothetical protein
MLRGDGQLPDGNAESGFFVTTANLSGETIRIKLRRVSEPTAE